MQQENTKATNPAEQYARVDIDNVDESHSTVSPPQQGAGASSRRVRFALVFPLALILCTIQALITVLADNVSTAQVTADLIPVASLALLMIVALAINPLLGLLKIRVLRAFNRPELVILVATILVTSGIGTHGLASQLVPLIATPWNPEWNVPQRGWDDQIIPYLNENLYITDPDAISVFRRGLNVVEPAPDAGLGEKIGYYYAIFMGIPWWTWIRPLLFWSIFILSCYGMYYCVSYIVLRYWSENEKLIFPLTKLPQSLLPEEGRESSIPPILKSAGFWAAFSIAFLILSWNAAVLAGWITGLSKIPMGMSFQQVTPMVEGTVLQGLGGGGTHTLMFIIYFVAIGIAFLLPTEISFSSWFYMTIGRLMILVAVWLGYGTTTGDFPSDWLWVNNLISGQGAGAMLVFSSISLYRSISEYFTLAKGRPRNEQVKLLMPVIGFCVCLFIMTMWLWWNNLGLGWSIVMVSSLTLVTVGLMRVVAEGGVYWFQAHVSFFHVYRMLGLGNVLAPVLIAPILLIYSVLFLDIKSFMAPNVINSAKLEKEERVPRAHYHTSLIAAVLLTLVVAVGFSIFLSYMRGAQQMSFWFYGQGPQSLMQRTYEAATARPSFNLGAISWYVVGGLWLIVSMIIRRTVFWFPHPIGYIMLVNPLMSKLWFSYFIGWLCKKLVVKYGGKTTFDKTKPIFIGLIIGHLMAVLVWSLIAITLGENLRHAINVNRWSFQ